MCGQIRDEIAIGFLLSGYEAPKALPVFRILYRGLHRPETYGVAKFDIRQHMHRGQCALEKPKFDCLTVARIDRFVSFPILPGIRYFFRGQFSIHGAMTRKVFPAGKRDNARASERRIDKTENLAQCERTNRLPGHMNVHTACGAFPRHDASRQVGIVEQPWPHVLM